MVKWEDLRDDLFEAVVQVHPPLTKDQQDRIVEIMRSRGHDMAWNAIRYVSQFDGCLSTGNRPSLSAATCRLLASTVDRASYLGSRLSKCLG